MTKLLKMMVLLKGISMNTHKKMEDIKHTFLILVFLHIMILKLFVNRHTNKMSKLGQRKHLLNPVWPHHSSLSLYVNL